MTKQEKETFDSIKKVVVDNDMNISDREILRMIAFVEKSQDELLKEQLNGQIIEPRKFGGAFRDILQIVSDNFKYR